MPRVFSLEVQAMKRKSGRMLRSVGIFLLGFLLVATLSEAAEREKVSFNADFVIYGRDAGFFAALGKGLYAEGGLDVRIVRGFGSTDTIKRLASGADDYGKPDVGTLVRARLQGMKAKALAMFHDKSLYAIYAIKNRGIEKPKDLEGRSIGIARGSALIQVFPALASVNKIDPSKIKWVYMDAPVTFPSVISGQVDATMTMYTNFPSFAATARKAGKEALGILWGDFGVDLYSSALMTSDQRIRDNPNQVRRFVAASMKGLAWAIEHPEEAVDIFIRHNPSLDREGARESWKITVDHLLTPYQRQNGLGHMSAEKMKFTRDVITQYAQLPAKVPVEDLYTNEFLPKLFPKRPPK